MRECFTVIEGTYNYIAKSHDQQPAVFLYGYSNSDPEIWFIKNIDEKIKRIAYQYRSVYFNLLEQFKKTLDTFYFLIMIKDIKNLPHPQLLEIRRRLIDYQDFLSITEHAINRTNYHGQKEWKKVQDDITSIKDNFIRYSKLFDKLEKIASDYTNFAGIATTVFGIGLTIGLSAFIHNEQPYFWSGESDSILFYGGLGLMAITKIVWNIINPKKNMKELTKDILKVLDPKRHANL